MPRSVDKPASTDVAPYSTKSPESSSGKAFQRVVTPSPDSTEKLLPGKDQLLLQQQQEEVSASVKTEGMAFKAEKAKSQSEVKSRLTYSALISIQEKIRSNLETEKTVWDISTDESRCLWASMNKEGNAHLMFWGDHAALVIGDSGNNQTTAFDGSANFVNWHTEVLKDINRKPDWTANSFAFAIDMPRPSYDGKKVSFTKECHVNGAPEVLCTFKGLDTKNMKKTWDTIRSRESYHALSNDCCAVVARVFKSGFSETEAKELGQPRKGLWSRRNVEVLCNRASYLIADKDLPAANAPLVPESVRQYLSATAKSAQDYLSSFVSQETEELTQSEKVALWDSAFV